MDGSNDVPGADLTEREIHALHELEVGAEWVRRAHGHLLAFHHAVGHGMDHFYDAEQTLRSSGYPDLADDLRDDVLPRGVTRGDRWSYDLVETFESTLLCAVTEAERETRESLADGERHVAERRQERRWNERAER